MKGITVRNLKVAQAIKWPDQVVQADFQYHHCETQMLDGFSSLTWFWGERSLCPMCVLFHLMQVVSCALEAFTAQDFSYSY